MATVASSPPPPVVGLNPTQQAEADQLDEEITSIRAEIHALTNQQGLLSSSLLASNHVQTCLQRHYATDGSIKPLLGGYLIKNQTSAHRLAFGITSFPFVDPAPDASNVRLLGIRFDVCTRNGEFQNPYYILLQRIQTSPAEDPQLTDEYRVHQNLIPEFVPVQKYAERYLPVADEGYGSENNAIASNDSRQDLMGFVTKIRDDLTSWHMRKEVIDLCKEKLTVEGLEDGSFQHGVQAIEAATVDAYQFRIVWQDGRVGRIKIDSEGTIQRAAVFDEEEGRCPTVERILLGGNGHVDELPQRLREIDVISD